ncbi:MAG TPA: hypothetical protein PLF51_03490, partial [Candidatus Hydrogenedentes bacterium]|nr:hypothetical protein [Candidatus Hydrogenedentota bacterium]
MPRRALSRGFPPGVYLRSGYTAGHGTTPCRKRAGAGLMTYSTLTMHLIALTLCAAAAGASP